MQFSRPEGMSNGRNGGREANDPRSPEEEVLRGERRAKREEVAGVPFDLLGAPGRLLTTTEAAGYLAISRTTLRIWVKQGRIPVIPLHAHRFRFRLEDLDTAILNRRRFHAKAWFESDHELPRPIVARLLGVKLPMNASAHRRAGNLKDYSPESVRAYIFKQARVAAGPAIRLKYRAKILGLFKQIRDLKAKYEKR